MVRVERNIDGPRNPARSARLSIRPHGQPDLICGLFLGVEVGDASEIGDLGFTLRHRRSAYCESLRSWANRRLASGGSGSQRMTIRDLEIEAEPIDAFEASLEVLELAITEGAFKELVSESPRHYAIGWSTALTGARYDFRFERAGGGFTRAEAELEFSGLLGPLLRMIRGAGNGPHLEKILGDIRELAESEEFYEDDAALDDSDEVEDEDE